jgi:hypothetical protein
MKIDTRLEPKQRRVFILLAVACIVLIAVAAIVGYRTLVPPPLEYPKGLDPKYGLDFRYLRSSPQGAVSPIRPGLKRIGAP